MNPMKIIAQRDWLRLIFGGIVTGGVIYGLVHNYPQIAMIAVPIAIAVGAISCFACEHMVEAVFKAIISGVIVFLALRMAPTMMAHDPQWWKIALLSVPLGLLGGMGVGSLLGGACRLVWEPVIDNDDIANNRK
ncbi:MAG: hypothetical protein NTV46_00200 [Verrucomicrobia bacterium]|nr:hypothetical protein [Verrucomicrobiota bacterium]